MSLSMNLRNSKKRRYNTLQNTGQENIASKRQCINQVDTCGQAQASTARAQASMSSGSRSTSSTHTVTCGDQDVMSITHSATSSADSSNSPSTSAPKGSRSRARKPKPSAQAERLDLEEILRKGVRGRLGLAHKSKKYAVTREEIERRKKNENFSYNAFLSYFRLTRSGTKGTAPAALGGCGRLKGQTLFTSIIESEARALAADFCKILSASHLKDQLMEGVDLSSPFTTALDQLVENMKQIQPITSEIDLHTHGFGVKVISFLLGYLKPASNAQPAGNPEAAVNQLPTSDE